MWMVPVTLSAQTQIKGRVQQADGKAIPGVNIRNKIQSTTTDQNGSFTLSVRVGDTLLLSHLAYQSRQYVLSQLPQGLLEISLSPHANELQEVQVSTGYQRISRERATGSFVQLDSAILSRRVSTNILERLEDISPGLVFNRSGKTSSLISIRGQNTIAANANPLIVIDNFPYEGDISNLNPNDVASITILKDAAAASIWGARAGNGVIVITTRKGSYNRKPAFSLNSNLTIGQKPDLFYRKGMSVSDYIATEQRLFSENYYDDKEASPYHELLSPLIEILIAERDQQISGSEAQTAIEALKQNDLRREVDRYLNRESINQQYSLSLNGGSERQKYLLSLGYDRNLATRKSDSYNRLSLNGNQSFLFLENNLELETGIYLTRSQSASANENFTAGFPYVALTDKQGNPVVVPRNYRPAFISTAMEQGLLDWRYTPLNELGQAANQRKSLDLRLNASLKYRITQALSASVLYQYNETSNRGRDLHDENSYYARNMINTYTQVSTSGLTLPIPEGGILDQSYGRIHGQNLRGQLSFDQDWSGRHELHAIAGAERKENYTLANTFRVYGYDSSRSQSIPVDYAGFYPSYITGIDYFSIPSGESEEDLTDRFISYYANLAYTYKGRYTLSASARKDQSNLFGVRTNQKGVPLYSLGAAWELSKENFYQLSFLPYLKLRATYGYNGNSFTNFYAFTTAAIDKGNSSPTLIPFARIENPPNPNLRWERTRAINLGADFASRDNRISGSFEYYFKRSTDLLGQVPVASSTGVSYFSGNFGSTKGHGFDLSVNSRNLRGRFSWESSLMLSMNKDQIVEYSKEQVIGTNLLNGELNTIPGKPLYSMSSYPWAGLNPQNGNPRGYLSGQISEDYNAILLAASIDHLQYHGYSQPPYYGALRNTFSYKGLSLSANVSFRLGYYYRQQAVQYGGSYGLGTFGDYDLRWQQPGDEAHTIVPSIPSVQVNGRDEFYRYTPGLVQKADHFRLQDIRLDYRLAGKISKKLGLQGLNLYGYVNNVGLLWKASSVDLDPDYLLQKPIRTFALGLKADF